MKKIIVLVLVLTLFLLPNAAAKQGHMRLLAVTETSNGDVGGIADLYLEIKPGTGRVYLETFPLTKVDTQISTRFAKEIACDFLDQDCDKYDFFYTITADSSIIGGPSAGSAIAVLTVSMIKGVPLDENVAITGTINSGGVIGPVGGIGAKIEAAKMAGMEKVLIPIGEHSGELKIELNESTNQTMNQSINETINETVNLSEAEEEFKIEIKEIATLDEALFEFTGKIFRERKTNITISQNYADTMKKLAIQLCSRSTNLRNKILNLSDNATKGILDNALNLSTRGKEYFESSKFYSSASFCFGSNVEFSYLILAKMNLTDTEIIEKIYGLRSEIESFDAEIDNKELKTVTDLESYMTVKERLIEANEFVDLVQESFDNNDTNLRNLAYAMERLNSAKSWAEFLDNEGKEFDFNNKTVENACRAKLSEVEERLQYVEIYLPQSLENTRKELEYAYNDRDEGNFELCLSKASKAKANVDTVLSVFGVKNEDVKRVVDKKLEIVESTLVEETEKGIFPIVGYSYFEYANSLKENDPFSALLYSEYALELSNLDIYFKTQKAEKFILFDNVDKKLLIVLVVGILLGFVIGKLSGFKVKNKKIKAK
ncbi:hypothetical protein HYW19_00570 [Candidatus Woesearchaeota archaeon]|nr:hypothetical protein [Candidatus Woesearchaeota archaeon]